MNPEDITEQDVRAMRQQGDLPRFFAGIIAGAANRNAQRRALVMRHPDLADRIAEMPGHAAWSGSVGRNRETAAIVEEAERRAAADEQPAAA